MSYIQFVNDDNFQSAVMNASGPILVDCFAPWCGPCRMIAPMLSQLADEFEGRAKIVKVDVDQSPALAQTLRVEAMPTLILFENGKEVDRTVGAPPVAALRQMLSSRTSSPSTAKT